MKKISAVYKIINTVTGDFYVGSSKDVKRRWADHKRPSSWKHQLNNPLYKDMQKYGVDKFRFQILAPVMEEYLKQVEQEFIDMLHPTYNNFNAKGVDAEKQKEAKRKYSRSNKGKEAKRKWRQSDICKEYNRKYQQTDKYKEAKRKYKNQLCSYNGETLKLHALSERFRKAGIEHPVLEAKKYLIKEENH